MPSKSHVTYLNKWYTAKLSEGICPNSRRAYDLPRAFYHTLRTTFYATLQEQTYKYRLFPMDQRMEGMALYHVVHPPIHRAVFSDYTFAAYPLEDLPWVTSHLDPKLVIAEAGRKLSLMDSFELKQWSGIHKDFFNSHPSLRRLLLLYEAWSSPIPADAYKDPGFISLALEPKVTPLKQAEVRAGHIDRSAAGPAPPADDSGWDPSSILQWSAEAAENASPHAAPQQEDIMETEDDAYLDAQDSKYDFAIGAGSRTPPRRLICSKDGKRRYWSERA